MKQRAAGICIAALLAATTTLTYAPVAHAEEVSPKGKGIAGGAPGTAATYQCVCTLHFESVDAFQAAFAPHAGEIMGDIANYTDAQPIVQIGEVKM